MKVGALKTHAGWFLGTFVAFVLGSKFQTERAQDSSASSADVTQITRVSSRNSSDGGAGGADFESRSSNAKARQEGSTVVNFADKLPSGDPSRLAEVAFKDPNPVVRRMAFSKLLESVTPENAAQIREQLAQLGAGGQMLSDFNYTWGAVAGEEAFRTAAANGDKRSLEALISGWTAADPESAIAMLDNLPEDLAGERKRLETGVVSGLADRDPNVAADFVKALAEAGNENARRLISNVIGEVLRQEGHEGASIWVERLEDGPLKGRAMDEVASRYVRKNPEEAAIWIQQFADQEYATAAIREIGSEWAERQPSAAVTWLESLPESKGQRSGLNSAFDDWEDRDPVAAGNYLLNMEESPKRDSAISGFAVGVAAQDPQAAIAWAKDISDPKLREYSLTRTGQIFYSRNPEAAKAWLAKSGLPASVQTKIKESRSRNKR